MESLQAIFIRNLKEARKRQNITQAKLSELINKSLGFIGDIEVGKSNPSLSTVEDIAKALNVQAFELFLPDPNILSDITIAGNMAEDIKRVLKRYDSYLQSGHI